MYDINLNPDIQERLDFISKSIDKAPEDIIIEALESYLNQLAEGE